MFGRDFIPAGERSASYANISRKPAKSAQTALGREQLAEKTRQERLRRAEDRRRSIAATVIQVCACSHGFIFHGLVCLEKLLHAKTASGVLSRLFMP